MSSKFYAVTANAYVYWMNLLKKLERGDADSSGSTLRTMGVVILILAVVLLIGGAVWWAAGQVNTEIRGANFPW
jgi:hypothetical protein